MWGRDEVRMCNCASCGVEMLGRCELGWYAAATERERKAMPPMTAGRVDGRPYCLRCLCVTYKRRTVQTGEVEWGSGQ